MKTYEATEQAYKNGYEKGKQDAVKHGRWKPQFEYDFDRGEYILTGYNCDQCGIWILKNSNYCPNCGARMN